LARSRIAVAGAEDKVEDALSSIGGVEVAIVVGDVVMLMKVAGGWKMLGAEFLNNSKTSPHIRQNMNKHNFITTPLTHSA